jgi:hypothetical protein
MYANVKRTSLLRHSLIFMIFFWVDESWPKFCLRVPENFRRDKLGFSKLLKLIPTLEVSYL